MELPQHRTPDQRFMSVMCELLDRQNSLLEEIRDRLTSRNDGNSESASDSGSNGGVVELKEPAAPPATAEQQPDEPDVLPLTEPEPAAMRTSRATASKKSTAAPRRRSPRGQNNG